MRPSRVDCPNPVSSDRRGRSSVCRVSLLGGEGRRMGPRPCPSPRAPRASRRYGADARIAVTVRSWPSPPPTARKLGIPTPHARAVAFVQRLGSALQLAPHFHVIVPEAAAPVAPPNSLLRRTTGGSRRGWLTLSSLPCLRRRRTTRRATVRSRRSTSSSLIAQQVLSVGSERLVTSSIWVLTTLGPVVQMQTFG